MPRKYQELRDKMDPVRRARVDKKVKAAITEMPLQELRQARALSQAQLAQTLGMTQPEISKIEHRTDLYVSTLRSYLKAMGGELEIIARFADGTTVQVNQFKELDEEDSRVLANA